MLDAEVDCDVAEDVRDMAEDERDIIFRRELSPGVDIVLRRDDGEDDGGVQEGDPTH